MGGFPTLQYWYLFQQQIIRPSSRACTGSGAAMTILNFTCALPLTLLLPITLFAFSVKLICTSDEFSEMGVQLETSESEGE